MAHRTCTLPDCDRPRKTRGLCQSHYDHERRRGTLADYPRERSVSLGHACSVDGCDNEVASRGWCNTHYTRFRKTGVLHLPPTPKAEPGEAECSEDGCEMPVKSRLLCSMHYQRKLASGELVKLQVWRQSVPTAPIPVVFGAPCLPVHFWERIVVTEGGCWRWTGSLTGGGYGFMTAVLADGTKTRHARIHVIAYEAFMGAVPDGKLLDHYCHTNDLECYEGNRCPHRACCRPEHLDPVDPAENVRRAHFKHKACCPAGHPYEPPHLAYDKDGYPDCRTCRNKRWRERYWRRRNAGASVEESRRASPRTA